MKRCDFLKLAGGIAAGLIRVPKSEVPLVHPGIAYMPKDFAVSLTTCEGPVSGIMRLNYGAANGGPIPLEDFNETT